MTTSETVPTNIQGTCFLKYLIQYYGISSDLLSPLECASQIISMTIFVAVSKVGSITKTRLYNFDPLRPHFYIVKLGFAGVHLIFHISAQNIDCGYSLEPPRRGGSNEYPQSIF